MVQVQLYVFAPSSCTCAWEPLALPWIALVTISISLEWSKE